MSVYVIAFDPADGTGAADVQTPDDDDYVITCVGKCWQESVLIEADGTHVITIRRPRLAPDDAPVLVTYNRHGECIAREPATSPVAGGQGPGDGD